jgi:3-mercaptopyruvate sulfurtransferase SseA
VFYCGRGVGASFVKAVAERFPSENIRAVYDNSYPEYYTKTTGLAYVA